MDPNLFSSLTRGSSDFAHGTLDDTSLERHCPLDHGRVRVDSTCSLYGLGDAKAFPNEVICLIFAEFDIRTFFNCRQLSRRTMFLINDMHEYKDLMRFAPNVFRGALAINTRPYALQALCDM